MSIFIIYVGDNHRYVGSTVSTIARRRWGHRVCAKSDFTCCSLYRKLRELGRPKIDLIELEYINDLESLDQLKLHEQYWIKKMNANLSECRAHTMIDGDVTIKRRTMECRCSEKKLVVDDKPVLLEFI